MAKQTIKTTKTVRVVKRRGAAAVLKSQPTKTVKAKCPTCGK